MNIKLRAATINDSYILAELGAAAAQGEVEHIFGELVSGKSAIELYADHIAGRYSQFNYENATIVEVGGEVAGMILMAPYQEYPDASYPGVPEQRLETMAVEEALIRPGFWHIEMVAVFERFAGQGLGKRLLEEAQCRAREGQYDGVSLTVDENNLRAVEVYLQFGFEEVDRIPRHPQADQSRGDVLLLIKPALAGNGVCR